MLGKAVAPWTEEQSSIKPGLCVPGLVPLLAHACSLLPGQDWDCFTYLADTGQFMSHRHVAVAAPFPAVTAEEALTPLGSAAAKSVFSFQV